MDIRNINFRLSDVEYKVLSDMSKRNNLSVPSQIREIVSDAIYYEMTSTHIEINANDIQKLKYGKSSNSGRTRYFK